MKHRDAADSKRYRMLAGKFIAKYGVATDKYDVIKGWSTNASYFYIAKEFARDNMYKKSVNRNEYYLMFSQSR